MPRTPQKRRIETRARLISAAQALIEQQGVAALRVEDVVAEAGVAKGTFFSHFGDKDGLLAVILGARVMTLLDEMETGTPPRTAAEICDRLAPLLRFIAADRVIFDLLLRYSGTTATQTDEIVTQGFMRQIALFADWIAALQAEGKCRGDLPALLLSEGIQAFVNHVLATGFCAEHAPADPAAALLPYVEGWLQHQGAA